jgi:predicted RNase H-related nuclease YkuK (DUF458 family)
MKEYKLFGGKIIEDVGQYAREYIKNNCIDHSEIIVYVGTDSKQLRKQTMYATAIAFYHIGKGVHVVFTREKIPKVKDLFTRLYNEVEMTRRCAEQLNKELTGHYYFRWTTENIWVEIGGVKAERLKNDGKLQELVDKFNLDLKHQKLITCDLDLNPSQMFKSSMVHDTGVGVLKGNGFRVRTKPDSWVASCAADLLCR